MFRQSRKKLERASPGARIQQGLTEADKNPTVRACTVARQR